MPRFVISGVKGQHPTIMEADRMQIQSPGNIAYFEGPNTTGAARLILGAVFLTDGVLIVQEDALVN